MIDGRDAAHDFSHASRVVSNALEISLTEGGDADVLIPAALLHDAVMYPKDDPRSENAAKESATKASQLLASLPDFPHEKIKLVAEAIENCSFANDSAGLSINALILQDADRLEATGAIAIMRTFWSAGQMRHPLYHSHDPKALNREPDGLQYGLDLFWTRLLKVEHRMNTETGRRIAKSRSEFLRSFVEQFERELGGQG